MGVIPLIKDETVTDTQPYYESKHGINGNIILIKGLDESQIEEPGNANITYDLRVGPEYRYLSADQKGELFDDDSINIPSGASILIQTEEHITLPKTVFGVVLTKVSLTQKGLTNTPSKVDPGYIGPLIITVTNFGKEPVMVRRGDKLCCIVFYRTETPAIPYEGESKRIISPGRKTPINKISELLNRHIGIIGVIIIILLIIVIYNII